MTNTFKRLGELVPGTHSITAITKRYGVVGHEVSNNSGAVEVDFEDQMKKTLSPNVLVIPLPFNTDLG